MSRPALSLLGVIALATVALEVVAFLAYRNTVDGQDVLANVAILVYGFALAAAVVFVDRVVRRYRSSRAAVSPRPTQRAGSHSLRPRRRR